MADCHEYFVNDILVHNCIAWLLAVWAIMNAKHLDVYGVNPGTNMSQITLPSEDKQVAILNARKEKILERIEDLTQMMNKSSDTSTRKRILSEITLLTNQIGDTNPTIPLNAEEFHRDPGKYINTSDIPDTRSPVNREDVEKSMRALFGV